LIDSVFAKRSKRIFQLFPGSAAILCPIRKPTSDTRERILDVAERLFMDNGYEATSMRTITSAAEVNLAAVNYHFGSKEALLCEVFRRRLTWLNQRAPAGPRQARSAGCRRTAQAVADTRSVFRHLVADG
jgi:AcrR family transcriptional regulator